MNKTIFYSKYKSEHRYNVKIKSDKKVHFRKVFKIFILLITLILVGFGFKNGYDYLHNSPRFNLKEVKIIGNKYLSKNEILALIKIENNKNIFKINIKEIKNKIKMNSQIKKVEVNRIFPSTIEINVEEREPVAYIGEDKLYQVDKEGVIFPSIKSYFYGKKLFVLTGFNINPNEIHKTGENVILNQSLAMINEINEINSPFLNEITRIDASELEELTLINENLKQEFKIGVGNWREKLERLISIFKNLKERRLNISYVDLRFRDEAAVMFKGAPFGR